MRHKKALRRLGVNSSHRKALLKNLCTELAEKGEIKTTLARAKELKREFDKLITLGKKATLHARRLAYQRLSSKKSVAVIFDEYAPNFKDRHGGYTRIYKLNNRLGDNAIMAKIAVLDYHEQAESTPATPQKAVKSDPKPDISEVVKKDLVQKQKADVPAVMTKSPDKAQEKPSVSSSVSAKVSTTPEKPAVKEAVVDKDTKDTADKGTASKDTESQAISQPKPDVAAAPIDSAPKAPATPKKSDPDPDPEKPTTDNENKPQNS